MLKYINNFIIVLEETLLFRDIEITKDHKNCVNDILNLRLVYILYHWSANIV